MPARLGLYTPMLTRLSIRDIVLIDSLDLDFERGMTVLTGETGAGKSILLDAFALALGARGDAGLVRHGTDQGMVTAVFAADSHDLTADILAELEITAEDDLILRRSQSSDGRTRAFVNDQPVSAQALRRIGRALVEIHGQHDERALVDVETHRALLDDFGGLDNLVAETAAAHRAWRDAERLYDAEFAALEKARADADYLQHVSGELQALAPVPGEEAELADERLRMMQAEKAAGDLQDALDALSGSQDPLPLLSGILRRLERRRDEMPEIVGPLVDALDGAIDSLGHAQTAAETALQATAFDPKALEQTEERLFALRAAARKHQVQVDDLPALAERFAADLAALDHGEARLMEHRAAADKAKQHYVGLARTLSGERHKAAEMLDAAVNGELAPLKLDTAQFLTRIDSAEPEDGGADGADRVEFWVRTNPGTPPGPMMKVASGGELSRFLLALKVSLAGRGGAPTLVFDEIDTGMSGAVSDAIGLRLHRLGEGVQVLAVTHAPQVAARAGQHLLIRKDDIRSTDEDRVATRVTRLDPSDRAEEVARMLAGQEVTDEARAAAARLLDQRLAG